MQVMHSTDESFKSIVGRRIVGRPAGFRLHFQRDLWSVDIEPRPDGRTNRLVSQHF